jgi:hypothetical protein
MAYLITTTNGAVLGEVLPQQSNNTFSSLTLIGEGLLNYGQYLNDDLIALTENFANTSSPIYPLVGQLWYNTASKLLNYYDGLSWDAVASQNWVSSNFVASASYNSISSTISNIIASDGLNSDGTKSNYTSNNYILNSDSLLSAISKLDHALSSSNTPASYLTISAAQSTYAPLISPNFSGIPTAPTASAGTNNSQIATTNFVSSNFVSTTSAGSLYLTVVSAASTYAPIASPTFTGSPTAPTPTTTDNSTKLATTAFVNSFSTTLSNQILTNVSGTYLTIAAAQSEYAPKVSPNFGGIPTAPTPATGNSSTQLATTQFVQNTITSLFGSNLSQNGYQKLSSGLIMQWTEINGTGPWTYPIAFPNSCFICIGNAYVNNSTYIDVIEMGTFSATQATFSISRVGPSYEGSGSGIAWLFALGF